MKLEDELKNTLLHGYAGPIGYLSSIIVKKHLCHLWYWKRILTVTHVFKQRANQGTFKWVSEWINKLLTVTEQDRKQTNATESQTFDAKKHFSKYNTALSM